MRITIMAVGSRGDVQPLAALGVGLGKRGHNVRLAAADEYGELVAGTGLEFIPLGFKMHDVTAAHPELYHLMAAIRTQVLKPVGGKQDAIISTFMGISTCTYARARSIPYFYAMLMPGLATRAFPHPIFPPLPLGAGYNALTYRLADRMALRACPDTRSLLLGSRPTYLGAFSQQVVARPDDWGSFAHVTGYWFLETAVDYQPPKELDAFLQAGPPPVVVSLGSVYSSKLASTYSMIRRALVDAGKRVILATDSSAAGKAGSADVFVTGSAPHDWLFARAAAVVHHGGAGTTATALRAGIPSVVIPFGGDQPFWGRRVYELGAAAAPLSPSSLTVGRLAKAIRTAVEDKAMHSKASAIGERLRAEDGVSRAIEIIEKELRV
ncbi:MAG: glycosyltransferase [Anaerolineae bacterium]